MAKPPIEDAGLAFINAQTGKPFDINAELAPLILASAIERRGRVLNIEMVCEVTESAPPGAVCVHRETGRTRLSFIFAAPGEDGTRPPAEFVPLSPLDTGKAAFLARMASLYDLHGEPEDEREETDQVGRVMIVRWPLAWEEPDAAAKG